MVQEFHVVRCFRCLSFQVQQEFGRGSGADCRRHVQKLNAMRGAMMEDQEDNTCEQVEAEEEEETEHTDDQVRPSQVSRWGKYLDTPQEEESKEEVLVGRNHLHGSNTNSRKRQRSEELADGRREDGCIPAKLQLPAVTSDATSSHSGSGSRWSHFLRAHRQGVECSVSGWSQSTGAVATKACSDDITLRPQFPVPSMFESGEEFNFDDDFQSF
ncbi:MRN complex-interacting protein isoform X4 [Girardinichthys multiradiatus]|uniref:MRN complex-interacting protein isoform X4 n=1 Tax=Girardinichthys multiradiatus TaxID=208333 RepID=UPI001FAC9209|nr:MRN complex-interacting protein isoform X4 [Girardinichthys multiradiatus]